MKKAKASAFRKWFEAQFGKRPSAKPWADLVSEATTAQYEANRLRRLVLAVEHYEANERAALYAWNARTKLKP